jgi:hypothetical protein
MAEKNLILVNAPRHQAIRDFEIIKEEIGRIDGSIAVHIAFSTLSNARLIRRLPDLPTLIVSFTSPEKFIPARGRLYRSQRLDKLQQIRLLADRGIPVPRTVPLAPGYLPKEEEWGEFVLVKPSRPRTTDGYGIELVRTRSVRYRPPDDYPPDHPARAGIMTIQQYIHTGSRPSNYRVLTLFGEPLYCLKGVRSEGEIDLGADDTSLAATSVATTSGHRDRELAADADVLELARRVHDACPEVPLKGIDIVREEMTGRLYVLEFNPGGNTWHFSSIAGIHSRLELGECLGAPPEKIEEVGRNALIAQFDAFQTAARVLVERTHAEAI